MSRLHVMVSMVALIGAAHAQTTPTPARETDEVEPGRVTYDAAFFVQFSPQTALDMVRQTPGFSLNAGAERRGFSGAVGNLLIDGLRPTSKSQSLDAILSRIPANQVLRIELLRGAEVAGDASGQAVLLNVVRTPTTGSGVYNIGLELASRDVIAPRGDLSYNGRNGNFEYSLGGSILSYFRDQSGRQSVYDGAGAHLANVETPASNDYREAAINGSLAFPLAGGTVSASGQINAYRFELDNEFLTADPAGVPLGSLSTVFDELGRHSELGLNYDRDIGPWSLALVGLIERGREEWEEDARDEDGLGGLNFTLLQEVRRDSGETILRGALSRALSPQHRIEFGGEAALNSLEQVLVLTGDPPVPPIPNSNILVEEERAEFFGVHTWQTNDHWALETRLAWETSALTFSGDTNQSVELAFWKPSLQLTRTFAGNNQVRLRVYRDVGQLDFGDFVSAAQIADDLIAGGNPDLVPQTDWRTELGADLRFSGGAALSLTLTHHQLSDVADMVLITAPDPPNPDILFDGPGNIGDGEAVSLDVNFSTPIEFIPGGRMTIQGYLWDTEVTDPVTGDQRIISRRPESLIDFNFRQDLPALQFAWGVSARKEGEAQAYRFNGLETHEQGPWVEAFVETTALPNGMKLRATAVNILDGTINRDRRFFDPDRTGSLVARDVRERRYVEAPRFVLTLSGTF